MDDWSLPAMALSVAGVTSLLCLLIFGWEIRDRIERWWRRKMRRRVWTHRAAALVWLALAYPAVRYWPTSVLFVIVSSLWANVYAPLATAEAADDRALMARLDRLEKLLEGVLDATREGQQQEGDLQEHPDGGRCGPAAEAGGGDRAADRRGAEEGPGEESRAEEEGLNGGR